MEEIAPREHWPPRLPPVVFMLIILSMVICVAGLLIGLLRGRQQGAAADALYQSAVLSPIFTPEVQYWAEEIDRWSATYGLDPNMVATVMQIESCGHPTVSSPAGAQGLFQVMPFHFTEGENPLDPHTNAYRGLSYLVTLLEQTRGNAGLAFAGYNGGPGAAMSGPAGWVAETTRYHYWSTGIYAEAQTGGAESVRLQEWLDAGGAALCRLAAEQLGIRR